MQSSPMQNALRTIWGALFAVSGVMAILWTLRVAESTWMFSRSEYLWAALAGLAALVVATYVSFRADWRPLVVIPAGWIATVAAVEAANDVPIRGLDGMVFYAGLALTFVLAYVLAKAGSRHLWTLFLAAILAASALEVALVGPPGDHSASYVISGGIVLLGGYLISRAFGSSARASAAGRGQLQPQA